LIESTTKAAMTAATAHHSVTCLANMSLRGAFCATKQSPIKL
jgi:hypothetical protein